MLSYKSAVQGGAVVNFNVMLYCESAVQRVAVVYSLQYTTYKIQFTPKNSSLECTIHSVLYTVYLNVTRLHYATNKAK